jgi:hypothetical protein
VSSEESEKSSSVRRIDSRPKKARFRIGVSIMKHGSRVKRLGEAKLLMIGTISQTLALEEPVLGLLLLEPRPTRKSDSDPKAEIRRQV